MAGFSDGVRLGGHGVIKRDPTVVMRVEMAPQWGDRDAVAVHWRGVAFDSYRHGVWSRSAKAPPTISTTTFSGLGRKQRRTLRYDKLTPDVREMAARRARAVEQNIYLDPLDTDVLFGASMPVVFETDRPPPGTVARVERNDEVRLRRNGTIHYQVWSELVPPEPAALRAITERDLAGTSYELYLKLPEEITAETYELAQRITEGKTTRYDKAVALRNWLTSNLEYTLEQEDPGEEEPVHFFLFTRKKGHCEYFASAFAVMARAVGIPTRNVNGFLGGEWNEYDQYVAVRAGDAHSWAEVYFDELGWVTFDATPPGQVDQLGRGSSGALARMQRFLDTLRFQWDKWVIEYDLGQQLTVFRGVGGALRDAARAIKAVVAEVWGVARRGWPLALLAMAGVGIWLWRRALRDRQGGAPAARRRASPVAMALLEAERALAKRGLGREASTTPAEHAAQLAARGARGAATYGELVQLHQLVVWGDERAAGAVERAHELAVRLRRELAERSDDAARAS
jgi:transglutaminase-like putative cysteine protease